MKKIRYLMIGLTLTIVAVPAFSRPVGFQITGLVVSPFADDPETLGDVVEQYRSTDSDRASSGVEMEIWIGSVGFGARHVARFDRFEVTDAEVRAATGERYDWWLDQKSDIFFSYHLFGGGAFLDPYVRYGIGFAAQIDLDDGVYFDDATGEWSASRPDSYRSDEQIRTAAIYQYLGVGLQTNVRGLVFGAGLNYTILNQNVYAGDNDWGLYPNERFEGRLYGGIALGGG